MRRLTPSHKKELEENRERRIDELIFAFGMVTCALTVLIVLSSWAK